MSAEDRAADSGRVLRFRHRSAWLRYGAAALFVVLACGARWLLDPVLSTRKPFPTFYVSVTAAAWVSGLGPTLFAVVLGYLLGDYFFVIPHHEFSAFDVTNTGTYFFVGLAITFFTHMMHAAEDRAQASAAEARDRQRDLECEIAERRRVERERENLLEQLRTARERLEAVLRQMPAGVVIAEAPSGRIVLANDQARRIWRRLLANPNHELGTGVHELRTRDGLAYLPHEWPLARSLARGEVVRNEEIQFPRDGGGWGTVLVSSSPIRDGREAVVAAVAVLYDITARKRAEEALLHAHSELEERVAERTLDLARANESLRAEIGERRLAEAARNDLLRRIVVVQEEERVRIARELHDQMGQQLTALKLGLEALERPPAVEGPDLRERLQRLLALTRQIGHDMHRIAWELGPAALDELDLPTALSNYAEEWAGHSGVAVKFQCTGGWERRLPPQVEGPLYRVVQEALTNVAKHAAARRLSLILNRRSDELQVIVEDDGVGFDTEVKPAPVRPGPQLGLTGMKERVQAMGGILQVESSPGSGTTLFVRLPLGRNGSR